MLTTPFSDNFYKAIAHVRRTINAGITTMRDAGGADLGIKQAQTGGLIVGLWLQEGRAVEGRQPDVAPL
jgi:hypothetical protein